MNSSTRVTVFTRTGCGPCIATRRALDAKGIAYDVRDVTNHPNAADELRALGFQQLPVVKVEGMAAWSGVRPDKLAAIHLDTGQRHADGAFLTMCSCGQEFTGADPDSADAAQMEHREQEATR